MATGNDDYQTLYHHTDKVSAKKIIESGYIKQSDPKDGDAIAGKGTYATSKDQLVSKRSVLKNNYDGMRPIDQRKADVAFEIEVPKDRVVKVKTDRDVYKIDRSVKMNEIKKIHFRDTGKTYQLPK